MEKKIDLRIRKTKANLYKSLVQLLKEKNIEDIKVTDICNTSMVNRSTFYDHFNDKYELLNAMLNDLGDDISTQLVVLKDYDTIKEYFLDLAGQLIDFKGKGSNIISTFNVLKKHNTLITHDIFKEALTKNTILYVNEHFYYSGELDLELVISFYIIGILNICFSYDTLKNTKKETVSEKIEFLFPDLDFFTKKSIG